MKVVDLNGLELAAGDRVHGNSVGDVRGGGRQALYAIVKSVKMHCGAPSLELSTGDPAPVFLECQWDHKAGCWRAGGEAGTWERGFYTWGVKKIPLH